MVHLRIALAQTSPISAPEGPPSHERPLSSSPFPTLDHNLLKVTKAVQKASEENADVVVFPEYFLQGVLNNGRQYLTLPSSHLLNFVQSLARIYNICIVGTIVHGSTPMHVCPDISPFDHLFPHSKPYSEIHQLEGKITSSQKQWAKYLHHFPPTTEETSQPSLKNTAFFIEGTTGNVLGTYVKRNLWHPERKYLQKGDDPHEVFNTKWGKAGLLICWDISHPDAAQMLSDLGADMIFVPTYWLSTDSEPLIHRHDHPKNYELSILSSLNMTRSFETETAWIMCNAGGDELEGFMGGSGVWVPFRGKLGGFDGAEENVKVVDLDLDVLKDARETYKIRQDWMSRSGS
ncbi:hypothetical protein M231_01645 [Tremella mesenterica]|uniref:CN hydrolase domain-containing protein n=1 Tax=Tremella mesenterica TaxID=5217 RepID=A0A4Q1BSK5_TREME|nr:hypothetical protein M231_01645 [Tremella mesenterica]